jgi:hypothetical protein
MQIDNEPDAVPEVDAAPFRTCHQAEGQKCHYGGASDVVLMEGERQLQNTSFRTRHFGSVICYSPEPGKASARCITPPLASASVTRTNATPSAFASDEKDCGECRGKKRCIFWDNYSHCKFGAACRFSHFDKCGCCGRSLELGKPSNFKTGQRCSKCFDASGQPRIGCYYFCTTGVCTRGDYCTYAHLAMDPHDKNTVKCDCGRALRIADAPSPKKQSPKKQSPEKTVGTRFVARRNLSLVFESCV